MDAGLVVQLCLAVGLVGLGVMLAVVGALVVAVVCGLAGGLWMVRLARRL